MVLQYQNFGDVTWGLQIWKEEEYIDRSV